MAEQLDHIEALIQRLYDETDRDRARILFNEMDPLLSPILRDWSRSYLRRFHEPNLELRADEVTYFVLMKIWKTWDKPTRWDQTKGPLAQWFNTLIQHSSTDLFRPDRSFREHHAPLLSGEADAQPEERFPDHNATPEEQSSVNELFQMFLAQISDEERNLLILVSQKQLSQTEIAIQLGLSDATVSRQLASLRKRLALYLQGDKPPT